MLQKKTLVAIGFLAAVGAAAAYKLTRPDPHMRNAGSRPNPGVPSLKAEEIDELEISEAEKPVVQLKKEGGEWKILAPVLDRADQKAVEAAVATLVKAKFKDVVAESATSYDKLQVKDDQVLRVVPKKGGSAQTTLLVGKTGRVRVGTDPRVWEVADLTRYALSREAKMWRDREILRLDKESLARLEVEANGQKVAVRREAPPEPPEEADTEPGAATPAKPKPPAGPDKWTIVEGQAAVGGLLDESVPLSLYSTLSHLDAADFADDAQAGVTGLDAPRAHLVLVMKDGSKKELLVGKEDGQDVYVKRPDSPRIWKIRKATADTLTKAPAQWRDKTLAKIETKDIAKLVLDKSGEKLALERTGDTTWKGATGSATDLDSTKVQSLAAGLARLTALAVVEHPDPKATGFAKPTGQLIVTKKDGTTWTMTVGAEVEKNYYVKVTGRDEVFTLAEYSVNRFMKTAADLKKTATPPMPGM